MTYELSNSIIMVLSMICLIAGGIFNSDGAVVVSAVIWIAALFSYVAAENNKEKGSVN